jgi:hypothetical protein
LFYLKQFCNLGRRIVALKKINMRLNRQIKYYILFLFSILNLESVFSQTVQWGKRGGGSGGPPINSGNPFEEAKGIGTDNHGNVYVVWHGIQGGGATIDGVPVNIPFSSGNMNDDIIISSFNCKGQYRWSKVIGCPTNSDVFNGFGVDSLGNTYCQINAAQLNCFKVDNDTTYAGNPNKLWFIVKYDSSGNFKWLRDFESDTITIASIQKVSGQMLQVDEDGTIYSVFNVGAASSLKGYPQQLSKGDYVLKINNQGQIINHISLNNFKPTFSYNLKFHKPKNQNRFYFWGDHGGYIDSIGNTPILFKEMITCFDMQGNLLWKREIEDTSSVFSIVSYASVSRVITSKKGEIYFTYQAQILTNDSISVLGYKILNDGITRAGGFSNTDSYEGTFKLDTNGNLIWGNFSDNGGNYPKTEVVGNYLIETSTYPSAPGSPFPNALAEYPKGQFLIFKQPLPGGIYIAAIDANTGQYLKLDTTLGSLTSKGSNFDDLYGKSVNVITSDNKGQIYIAGKFNTDLKVNGQTLISSGGESDMFLVKWGDTCGANLLSNTKLKIQDSRFFDIYPNPASKEVTLSFNQNVTLSGLEVRIYDMMGKKVYSEKVKSNFSATINTSPLQSGMYNVVLYSSGKLIGSKKLIIEK